MPPRQGPQGPVIRDNRRIDPETGQPRESGRAATDPVAAEQAPTAEQPAAPEPPAATAEADATEESSVPEQPGEGEVAEPHPDTQLAADRLEDLRRLQAEYVNYKRRVDRDRERERERAVGSVVEALLPVMDDIHSAREHGDLTEGPFAAIADKLEATLARFGVARFGEVGEAFDPTHHEALMHLPEADLPEGARDTTVVQVLQPGFKVGEQVVRAARVAVADPPQ
ncbi:nucleotide exchange factor GrpE [Ornithinicoccus halotolerans]|uniref:nucleotide exchange factor GrpE n=1 Tax=Ornithinicoccus halotolerans TaxID=1748220 RepID=UPI001E581B36|nr:nucleotide exchange factor GrpE [Ornithinicoccus halotolerans]